MKIDLKPGEAAIDTWALILVVDGKPKYNGQCTVTNERILFEVKADVSSLQAIYDSAHFVSKDALEIQKKDITDVQVEKSFLAKKVLITVKGGKVFVLSRGALNIDPVVEAINAR